MANKPFSEIVNGLRNCKNVHDLNDWRGFKDCKNYKASRDRDDVWSLWRKVWGSDIEAFKAWRRAVEATPEYKDWKEAEKALDEAWKVVEATPEWKDLKEVEKDLKKIIKASHGAWEGTPTYKAYREAEKAKDEEWSRPS